jgi:hypothetical protein
VAVVLQETKLILQAEMLVNIPEAVVEVAHTITQITTVGLAEPVLWLLAILDNGEEPAEQSLQLTAILFTLSIVLVPS